MCGICGKLEFNGNGISGELIRSMTRSFSYRGPDDEGVYCNPPIGLGHRRLSIIDLSPSGHQPMSNEDGSIWMVFNGEIYDFEEHRHMLKSKGHNLKSRTDCEVIIHLYEEEGINCIKKLNGMFAFALWDAGKKQLFLVRDRIGIKPIQYFWDGQVLVFASEIKAILQDPHVFREIDPQALDLYLTLNYVPAPWTIYKNIRKLEPATYLIADREGISVERYWDIKSESYTMKEKRERETLEEQKKRLYTLLEEAVKRRLISDVPLGAFLSGGLDSSIIVALMARNSNQAIKTFSIGYKDLPSFDETRYARDVANLYKTDHREFKLGFQDILDVFPLVLENVDEPFADSSAVPTYIVSRETKNHVTVALSGDGGDELFAGYRMYQGEYWSRYYSFIPKKIRDNLLTPLVNTLPDARDKPSLEKVRRIKKFVKGMSDSFPERFYGWREIFPFSTRQEILREPPVINFYLDLVNRKFKSKKDLFPSDIINLMLYMDVKGLLHGDMLNKVDRMSMANSLEVRVPLLDHTVVEYVFNLEGSVKLKGRTGKYIFLETFRDLIPKSLHNRPKWGFEMPISAWLKNELRFLVDEYLGKDQINKQKLFKFEEVNHLVNLHMSGRQDTSWQLWNLIVFQYWYQRYF